MMEGASYEAWLLEYDERESGSHDGFQNYHDTIQASTSVCGKVPVPYHRVVLDWASWLRGAMLFTLSLRRKESREILSQSESTDNGIRRRTVGFP